MVTNNAGGLLPSEHHAYVVYRRRGAELIHITARGREDWAIKVAELQPSEPVTSIEVRQYPGPVHDRGRIVWRSETAAADAEFAHRARLLAERKAREDAKARALYKAQADAETVALAAIEASPGAEVISRILHYFQVAY